MSEEIPPIRLMPGNGMITRVYTHNSESRERARAFLRKRYDEGFQCAFQYFTPPGEARRIIQHLARFMAEPDE